MPSMHYIRNTSSGISGLEIVRLSPTVTVYTRTDLPPAERRVHGNEPGGYVKGLAICAVGPNCRGVSMILLFEKYKLQRTIRGWLLL